MVVLFLSLQTIIFGNLVVVKTQNGDIRGKQENNYISFLGIPFGEQPKRWRPPVAKKSWSPGIFNATNFGNLFFFFSLSFCR